jgi:hypothetical protein
LDIVGTTTSVENLNADFALGETSCVESDNGQDSFENLPSDDSRLREPATKNQNITPEILQPEGIFDVADEVTMIKLDNAAQEICEL